MNTIVADIHAADPTPAARCVVTRAGIRIGIAHVRAQPQYLTPDDSRVQTALLEPRTMRPLSGLQRLAGAFWKWC